MKISLKSFIIQLKNPDFTIYFRTLPSKMSVVLFVISFIEFRENKQKPAIYSD